jgi:endo-1,3-1,4-beta-glycanase ExoK
MLNQRVTAVSLAALAASVVFVAGPSAPAAPGWQDEFSGTALDSRFWDIGNGRAPGYIAGRHIGYYQPDHVALVSDGGSGRYLRLLLTQETGPVDANPNGTISRGALVSSDKVYGYGTYEWRMRMSSTAAGPLVPGNPVSGSVSAGFIYVNNSKTEIDFEFTGSLPDTLYLVNWANAQPASDPTPEEETFSYLQPFDVTSAFRLYKFVWEPTRISFYVDGILKAVHTTNVPGSPAHFMINHWGTDSVNWGGPATPGTPRYFYVDWVRFTPR